MQLATITVCLSLSQALSMAPSTQAALLREVNGIWQQHGVTATNADPEIAVCDRRILVKSEAEARPEDGWTTTALAWVPFAGTYARRLIFLRLGQVRSLVASLSPGQWPEGLRERLVTKLAGRVVAHELGHILLNSRAHERSGLMQDRYRAQDVLRTHPSAYSLSVRLRAQMVSTVAAADTR